MIFKKKILLFSTIILFVLLGTFFFLERKEEKKSTNPFEDSTYYKKEFKDRYSSYLQKHPTLSKEEVVKWVNIGLDQEFYTNLSKTNLVDGNLMLVNKFHYLEESYVPEDLETLDTAYSAKEVFLKKEAKDAFTALAKEAKKQGYTIVGYSGYRSYRYQKQIYTRYCDLDGVEKADTYSARPGFSEHQTGLALDVSNQEKTYTEFGTTKEYQWMLNNAYKFGFILRYPKGSETITGYQEEAWHYRYVGMEVATYLFQHPMTYEEYYMEFMEK